MSKYVSADTIVDRVCEGISCNECSFGTNEGGMSECVLYKRIAKLPTADVVRVVRCINCKECEKRETANYLPFLFCKLNQHSVSDMGFCCWGTKGEEDE